MSSVCCGKRLFNRQLMFTASAIALLAASNAEAQEFPNFAAGSDWQGIYAGLHGGYGWGDTDASCPSGCDTALGSYNTEGVLAGAQIGYNWELAGFLVGLEGDISFSAIEGDAIFGGKTASSELDWLSTLRARAGVLATNDILIYGTGGIAWGDWEDTFNPLNTTNSWTDIRTGWTAGGGIEAKVSEQVSLKAEYLYVDFGDKAHTWSDPTIPIGPTSGTVTFDHQIHTVRIGLNVQLY